MDADRPRRLSPTMKRALLNERDGRIPLLEAGLKAKGSKERRGAERTKMALIERGFLMAAAFARCELTSEGMVLIEEMRREERRKAIRNQIKADKLASEPRSRWGPRKNKQLVSRWGECRAKKVRCRSSGHRG